MGKNEGAESQSPNCFVLRSRQKGIREKPLVLAGFPGGAYCRLGTPLMVSDASWLALPDLNDHCWLA
jgi:hypothetical protein